MTQATYRLDIYNTSGTLQYVLDLKEAPTSLGYSMRVNAPGVIKFDIAGDHDLLSDIGDKWQVEVWRRPYGEDWAREMSAFYRDLKWKYDDKSVATLFCDGLKIMLNWRIVAYDANTANRSKFTSTACETIANTLVTYNATTSGTTGDGRDRAAAGGYPFTGLSVEANGAAGNSISYYCARKNLLEALQELSDLSGGGDFDIVKTSSTAWQWRWYDGQLGTDRSATVVFALDRGNMKEPQFDDIKSGEKTVAIIGGQGEETERDISVRTGTNYSATNDIEIFVNANDIDQGATAALQARGDQELSKREALTAFTFGVLQTENLQYGVDYDLGDLVTAINPYDSTSYTHKIKGVTVSLASTGEETIQLDMSEPL